jgi:group I intron endonuclease
MVGVYLIQNKINNYKYVGESLNIVRRWKQHIKSLDEGTHTNKSLQNAWDKYGESNFEFIILESFTIPKDIKIYRPKLKSLLLCREHYYVKLYDSINHGYNLCDSYLDIINLRDIYSPIKNIKAARKYIKDFVTYCPDVLNENFCFEQNTYLITTGDIKQKVILNKTN